MSAFEAIANEVSPKQPFPFLPMTDRFSLLYLMKYFPKHRVVQFIIKTKNNELW